MRSRAASFLLTFLLVLLAAAPSRADERWSLGLAAGWQRFGSDYGRGFHDDPTVVPNDAIEIGARGSRLWRRGFGVELAAGWSPTKLERAGQEVATLHASFVSLRAVYDPEPGPRGAPYVAAGVGAGILYVTDLAPGATVPWIGAGADTLDSAYYPGYLDLAAGWTIGLSDPWHLRFEAHQPVWIHNGQASNPGMTTFGVVLTWHTGRHGKDSDADGVADRDDQCANTPTGVHVDRMGCPIDTDGDGVPDGLDWCQNSAAGAMVDERGCGIDADLDGVVDSADRCPYTPQRCSVTADGCPIDTDGDGVCDGVDRCSATPGGWAVNAEGCPIDSDGDGVPDGADRCPGTARGVPADSTGCPRQLVEMEAELARTGTVNLPLVFEPGSVAVLSEHAAALDLAGLLVTRWPDLKFEIVVQPGANEPAASSLGGLRAQTVRDEIARRSFAGPRLSARGRAPASRTSSVPARVDLVALDRAALRAEAERRGLLDSTTPRITTPPKR